jgi:hypothetical protein
MPGRWQRRTAAWIAGVAVAVVANAAAARPTYFATLRTHFGIPEDSRIDACGVCHRDWEGTGARNAFGTAVEQRLYTGLSIAESLDAVDVLDSDGDGYTNADELRTHLTLPGYDCNTFDEAVGAPEDYHAWVTPGVATCLPPLDLRLSEASVAFLTAVGKRESLDLTIINYGAALPLVVESYGLVGAGGDLSVRGETPPLTILPGERVTLTVAFTPRATASVVTHLRLVSNDPDQAVFDLPVSAFGFVRQLAPPAVRAGCRSSLEREHTRYAREHLGAWIACAVDEASGRVCRRGVRDRRIAVAERRLRERVGGARDKACAGEGLTPSLLDYPGTCGGECAGRPTSSLAFLADCLVCRQEATSQRAVAALAGARPPDLPPTVARDRDAAKCIGRVGAIFAQAAQGVARARGGCEIAALTAETPRDCAAETVMETDALAARVNGTLDACASTDGLPSCPFQEDADPACLGTAAVAVGAAAADAVYDRNE